MKSLIYVVGVIALGAVLQSCGTMAALEEENTELYYTVDSLSQYNRALENRLLETEDENEALTHKNQKLEQRIEQVGGLMPPDVTISHGNEKYGETAYAEPLNVQPQISTGNQTSSVTPQATVTATPVQPNNQPARPVAPPEQTVETPPAANQDNRWDAGNAVAVTDQGNAPWKYENRSWQSVREIHTPKDGRVWEDQQRTEWDTKTAKPKDGKWGYKDTDWHKDDVDSRSTTQDRIQETPPRSGGKWNYQNTDWDARKIEPQNTASARIERTPPPPPVSQPEVQQPSQPVVAPVTPPESTGPTPYFPSSIPSAAEASRTPDFNFMTAYQNALSEHKNGSYLASIEAFHRMLQTEEPNNLTDNIEFWLGESFYALGNYSGAQEYFERVMRYPNSEKQDDALFMRGNSYMMMGKYNLAGTDFERLLDQYPSSEYSSLARQKLQNIP